MDLPGPRWKKGKDGKDFAALAAANPMSSIVAELQASLRDSQAVAILSGPSGDAVLQVQPNQAALLNRSAFGRAVENAGGESQWFQLGPEEVFFLCRALKCIAVESENKKQMSEPELWGLLSSASELFPGMYKAYEHLRLKNWVVRSGLQYGADFVAYRHHPALVHSEFAVIVVLEDEVFGTRCGRMKVWSDLLCALRASGSVAKTLLVLTICCRSCCDLRSSDCLEQMTVQERTITRWIPQQCREQQDKPRGEERSNRDEQIQKSCGDVSRSEEQEHAREGFQDWRSGSYLTNKTGLLQKQHGVVVRSALHLLVPDALPDGSRTHDSMPPPTCQRASKVLMCQFDPIGCPVDVSVTEGQSSAAYAFSFAASVDVRSSSSGKFPINCRRN
ncbi:hypothetical protein U9M48_029941, partial [Paspalum notatum var. saurae]